MQALCRIGQFWYYTCLHSCDNMMLTWQLFGFQDDEDEGSENEGKLNDDWSTIHLNCLEFCELQCNEQSTPCNM